MEQPSVSKKSYELLGMSDSESSSSAYVPPLILTSPRKKRFRKYGRPGRLANTPLLVCFMYCHCFLIPPDSAAGTDTGTRRHSKNVTYRRGRCACSSCCRCSSSGCWRWVGSSTPCKTNWTSSTTPLSQVRFTKRFWIAVIRWRVLVCFSFTTLLSQFSGQMRVKFFIHLLFRNQTRNKRY